MSDENRTSAEEQAALDQSRPQGEEGGQKEEKKGSFKLDLYFWTQALTAALVFLILTFTLAGRVIGVVGESMLPTLHEGDLLLLQSVGYTPKQGDVVVLRKSSFLPEPIVKRVIATEGQHVEIDYEAGLVYVDGTALDEPYINGVMLFPTDSNETISDVTVPEGSIFVMGDNRNNSSDSRDQRLGTVDTRYVLGRALWIVTPFDHFGAIE